MQQSIKETPQVQTEYSPLFKSLSVIILVFSLLLLSQEFLSGSIVKPEPVKKLMQQSEKPEKERRMRVGKWHDPKENRSPLIVKKTGVEKTVRKSLAQGNHPAIDASFSTGYVLDHITALERLAGAKLILFCSIHRKVLGSISGERFIPGGFDLQSFSLRARNITHDLPAQFRNSIIKQANALSHPNKFLIVLPTHAETYFERTLASQLESQGIDWHSVGSIELLYEKNGAHIMAKIKHVKIKDSAKSIAIGKTIQLW